MYEFCDEKIAKYNLKLFTMMSVTLAQSSHRLCLDSDRERQFYFLLRYLQPPFLLRQLVHQSVFMEERFRQLCAYAGREGGRRKR